MAEGLNYEVVQKYVASLVPPRSAEVEAMEQYASENRFPIVGPACGQACYMLARMIGARRVFEMGSGYGYSTSWFARAVRDNGGGSVEHVVWDAALSSLAKAHLDRMGLGGIVNYHVGEAVDTLRRAEGPFDIVFNDIDKHAYPEAWKEMRKKVRVGGLAIADNALWHGRIFEGTDRDASTEGIRAFTKLVTEDKDWISILLPLRDGLFVALRNV